MKSSEEQKDKRHAWYVKHRDERKAYQTAYNAAHREEHAAYYKANKEEINSKTAVHRAAWYAAHREEAAAYGAAYRKANPDKRRAIKSRRRARKREAEGTYTEGDIKAQYTRQKGKCFWCGKRVGKDYHVDHVVPLSRGGSNWPENLVIACAKCNIQKGDKFPHEWAKGGRLL